MARIALLADRLRVEERLLIEAFAERGHQAVVLPPAKIHLSLQEPTGPRSADAGMGQTADDPGSFDLAIERGLVTSERSALAALLAAGGTPVINRAATARLLADRVALLRHLIFAGIPVPKTLISFGEEATFAAIEALGYPVLLTSLTVDPNSPIAIVEDGDAAEAIVEHRTTLGGERAVLVQRFVHGRGRSIRLVVVGEQVIGIEERPHGERWRPAREAPYSSLQGDASAFKAIARSVIARLGTGTYAIEVVESAEADGEPVVVGVGNLADFRTLADRGTNVAALMADFALGQLGTGT